MNQQRVRTGSGYIERRTGAEGPRHDPYGYTEIEYVHGGDKTVWHEGLGCWVEHNGIRTGPAGFDESVLAAEFKACTGYTPWELERFLMRARERCRYCGGRDFCSVAGFPGETLYVCTRCDKIGHGDFNLSAVI